MKSTKSNPQENSHVWLSTKRIETLVDGIFAIAMTLLVLALAVPDIAEPLTNGAIVNALYGLIPSLYTLILSFILLALFWNIHHRTFQRINEVNDILLWINMFWLLFIVLVPFSATLTGKYGQFPASHIVFNINMIGIGIFLYLNTYYAVSRNFIKEETDQFKSRKNVSIGFIFIALLALLSSFIFTSWSSLVYLLIIPLNMVTKRL